MSECFVVFFRLPFEKRTYCVSAVKGNLLCGFDIQFSQSASLVTANWNDYVSSVGDGISNFASLFDLNTARKLLTGRPRDTFESGHEPWKGLSTIGRSFADQELFAKVVGIERNKFGSFSTWLESLPTGWQSSVVEAMNVEYERLKTELTDLALFSTYPSDWS